MMAASKQLLKALGEQLESIAVVSRQIVRHQEGSTDLELRQYRHLRDEYLQQLIELMEQLPDSAKLGVIERT